MKRPERTDCDPTKLCISLLDIEINQTRNSWALCVDGLREAAEKRDGEGQKRSWKTHC